jgi:hypothetical protein
MSAKEDLEYIPMIIVPHDKLSDIEVAVGDSNHVKNSSCG